MDSPATDPAAPSRRGRNLFLLWLGQFVSGTGDSVFSVSVGFFVIYLLGPGAHTQVGLTRMMDALPFLLFGAYAGVLVDRFSRRGAMLLSDIARALIVGTIPLLYFAGVLQWWMLPVAAFLSYAFVTFFNPARDAIIPDLAEGANLLRVNSVFQTSQQLAVILGAGLVGVLLAPAIAGERAGPDGIAWLLALNAIALLFSFVCIALIRPPARAAPTMARPGSLRELADSLSSAWRDARLRSLLFLTAVDNFFIMGPAIVGAMFLIKGTLGLELWAYGVFEACLGAGWLIGTLLLARFGRNLRTGRLVIAGMFFDGITYVPFLFLQTFEWFLVAIFAHGLFIPLITVGRTTLIQRHYPRERLGRIFALVAITVQGFTALSALATGLALQWLEPRELFFWGGLCGAACGVIGLSFKALRRTE
ncbi:MAG: MFS transporter [Planctomycetes bacterium]|nr:MFS transporter [Planctomycetota bacterium]MCW8135663.1 MFS transporter [Planctomycetota bacterium]